MTEVTDCWDKLKKLEEIIRYKAFLECVVMGVICEKEREQRRETRAQSEKKQPRET